VTIAAVAKTKKVSSDATLIKSIRWKIVEQLDKQDEILEQVAWIKVVLPHRNSGGDHETTLTMDRYPDNLSDYAESSSSYDYGLKVDGGVDQGFRVM
jgi:hypothetical protein